MTLSLNNLTSIRKVGLVFCLIQLLAACSPMVYQTAKKTNEARLIDNQYITRDDTILPVKKWLPENNPQAVIIALHGFNDYSKFFQMPGDYLKQHGIASYAYDQRGFGQTAERGYWPGVNVLTGDLITFIQLIRRQHHSIPIYVLGHSMGGAVVIAAMAQDDAPPVDGLILAAPAVWGRKTMPWFQTVLLEVLGHTTPWLTLTGEGLEILPSDNIKMLRAQSKDPLVIKKTRVDAIYGLVNLMDAALENASKLNQYKTLFLYGEKDQVIPENAVNHFLQGLETNGAQDRTLAFFPDSYHMLLRDLQAKTVWNQIWAWIASQHQPEPAKIKASQEPISLARPN